jgi:hypothetical protein
VAPGYLEALDRMTVGSDEWDLVAALTEPRSVRDVCRASAMGDFRSAQTLWALKTLGVITDSQAQPVEASRSEATSPHAAPAASAAAAQPRTVAPSRADEPWNSTPAKQPAPQSPTSEPAPAGVRELAASFDRSTSTQIGEAPSSASPTPDAVRTDAAEAARVPDVAAAIVAEPTQSPAPAEAVVAASVSEAQPAQESASASPEPPAPEAGATDRARPDADEVRAEVQQAAVPEAAPSAPEPVAVPPSPADEAARPVVAPADTVHAEPAPVRQEEPQADEEDLEPIDPELARQIERFNACQQIVYRVVRAEVGAGASNFVRFCGLRLGDGFDDLFARVDLLDDGTWDPAGLRKSVRKARVSDPWLGFQRLIEKEIEMVQVHLGAGQAGVLRRRLEEFDRADATL